MFHFEIKQSTYQETRALQSNPLSGGGAFELLEKMLGVGTDLSAVYVRGVTPDSKEEKKAWFDIALEDFRSNLARYERVDSLVIIASAYESANERGMVFPHFH